MKWTKLTALSIIFISAFALFSSCEKSDESKKANLYSKTGIAMTGAQNIPASTSTATGSIDVSYDKRSKLLTYKVTWTGLSGAPTGMSVYGLAPVGFPALSPGIIQAITTTGFTASGTYSSSILCDEVVFKEQDVLNGLFYIGIRTAAWPNGELRGQIKFQ